MDARDHPRLDAGALADLLNSLVDGVVVVDRRGIVRYVNASACELLGRSRGDLLGQQFGLPVVGTSAIDINVVRPDGVGHAELRGIHFDWEGRPSTLLSIHDVTERHRAESAMREALDRISLQSAALEASSTPMAIAGRTGQIIWCNAALLHMCGRPRDGVIGHDLGELFAERERDESRSRLWAAMVEGNSWQAVVRHRRADASVFPVEQVATPIRDDDGELTHVICVYSDLSERLAYEDELRHLATHDALTRTLNRRGFVQGLDAMLRQASRSGDVVAVAFVDLDGFKRVNDVYGHAAGDRLLQAVAERIAGRLRATDLLSRFGGDEFAVAMAVEGENDAAAAVRRVLPVGSAQRVSVQSGVAVSYDMSVGVAVSPRDGMTADDLLKHADMAMYEAKSAGRGRVRYFSEAMDRRVQRETRIEAFFDCGGMDDAALRSQLSLAFQPQVGLRDGRVTGVEALLRWTHPELGPVPPAEFIPVAERGKAIGWLGKWVIDEALAAVPSMQPPGVFGLRMAINVSAAQLDAGDLSTHVLDACARSRVAPSAVELEVTETMLLERTETVSAELSQLREHGVGLAIDDFGTGYASMRALLDLPLTRLKIDRSFVLQSLDEDERGAAVVRSMIDLGHRLGAVVIAEGIETPEQLAFLRAAGCDEGQGYLFSKPVPAEQVGGLLASAGLLTDDRP